MFQRNTPEQILTQKGAFYISGFSRIRIIPITYQTLFRLNCIGFLKEKAKFEVWFQF